MKQKNSQVVATDANGNVYSDVIYVCCSENKNVSYTYHSKSKQFNSSELNDRYKIAVDYSVISAQIKNLTGRILTIIDASISDREQRKAIKDLIRNEMIDEFEFYSNLVYPYLTNEYVEKNVLSNEDSVIIEPPSNEEILGA